MEGLEERREQLVHRVLPLDGVIVGLESNALDARLRQLAAVHDRGALSLFGEQLLGGEIPREVREVVLREALMVGHVALHEKD